MLTLPPSVRIFFAAEPTDMRRSFDGLAMLAREVIRQDPLSGHLFVFRNRSGDKLKVLWWDRSGFCLYYKRLEEGVFAFPDADGGAVEIGVADLMLILEGIDLAGARRRKRFSLPREFSEKFAENR
ncbi:MAG: IS66 family insertion sequence element accessory protein TnpB [Hydrogenophilus sp.]|nr:IS66 family insertion sequence element accessory protein TnpB [Hydrogenophilus sp.]